MSTWGKEGKTVESLYLKIMEQIWEQFDTVPSCDKQAVSSKRW